MKKYFAIALLMLACSAAAMAQTSPTPHHVDTSYTLPSDATAASVYKLYRAQLASASDTCTASLTYSVVTQVTGQNTMTDNNVTVGAYCYYVTQTLNGSESGPSNIASATIVPNAPSGFTITTAK